MTKRAPTSNAASDLAQLAACGIDATALDDGTIADERLGALLRSNDAASAALARLLGERPRPAHAILLAEIEPETHGALRREIRRALFRLKRAGIEAPRADSRAAPGPAATSSTTPVEAWVSHIDGRGDQLVWITKSTPTGVLFVSARINDIDGLLNLAGHDVSRRQLRLQRRELLDRHGLRMVEIDWRHADALLTAAYARHAPVGEAAYPTLRTRFASGPPAPLTPPIHGLLAPDAVDPALADDSAALLDEPEFSAWLPAPADVEPFVREMLDVETSPLVLDRRQQEERVTAIIERATGVLFPAATCAPRLETMAYLLWKTDREQSARVATATARVLREGRPSQSVPLFAGLGRATIAAVYRVLEARAKEDARDSLIVKPGSPAPPGGRRA
jgi:hypothetical protein